MPGSMNNASLNWLRDLALRRLVSFSPNEPPSIIHPHPSPSLILDFPRSMQRSQGERGFHIFYQALSGANGDSRSVTTGAEEELEGFKGYTLETWRIGGINTYTYLGWKA